MNKISTWTSSWDGGHFCADRQMTVRAGKPSLSSRSVESTSGSELQVAINPHREDACSALAVIGDLDTLGHEHFGAIAGNLRHWPRSMDQTKTHGSRQHAWPHLGAPNSALPYVPYACRRLRAHGHASRLSGSDITEETKAAISDGVSGASIRWKSWLPSCTGSASCSVLLST